jgi:hypothetical protein
MVYYLPKENAFTQVKHFSLKWLAGKDVCVMTVGMIDPYTKKVVYHQTAYLKSTNKKDEKIGEWSSESLETDCEIENRLFDILSVNKK